MFEKFSDIAVKAILLAQEEARRLGHNFVGPEMILLGVIGLHTRISEVMVSFGLTLKIAREEVQKIYGLGSGSVGVEILFTDSTKDLLGHAFDEMRTRKDRYIGGEHLVLGFLRLDDTVAVRRIFKNTGIEPGELKDAVVSLMESKELGLLELNSLRLSVWADDFAGLPGAKVINLAQQEARRLAQNFIGTEQILLGIIGSGGKLAGLLDTFGVDLLSTRAEVKKIIGIGSGFLTLEIPFTPRAKRVLEFSWDEARRLGSRFIEPEHLLLGLIREGGGVACHILEQRGVKLEELKQAVLALCKDE